MGKSEREPGYDVRRVPIHPDWPRCSLCNRQVRSLYSLPGDTEALMCSACFFSQPRITHGQV